MIEKRDWKEFKDSGFLWFVNSLLQIFGWVIVFDLDDDRETVKSVYPARTKYRGFSKESNDTGYKNLTTYMKNNSDQLLDDVNSSIE